MFATAPRDDVEDDDARGMTTTMRPRASTSSRANSTTRGRRARRTVTARANSTSWMETRENVARAVVGCAMACAMTTAPASADSLPDEVDVKVLCGGVRTALEERRW